MWYLHSHFVWFRLPVLSIWFLLSFAWRLTIESFQHGLPYPRKRKTSTVAPAKPGDYLFYLWRVIKMQSLFCSTPTRQLRLALVEVSNGSNLGGVLWFGPVKHPQTHETHRSERRTTQSGSTALMAAPATLTPVLTTVAATDTVASATVMTAHPLNSRTTDKANALAATLTNRCMPQFSVIECSFKQRSQH